MRVLLATYASLPHVGGLSTYVKTLQEELHRSGLDVDVIASTPDVQHYYMPNRGRYVGRTPIDRRVRANPATYLDRDVLSGHPAILECEIQRCIFEGALAAFGLDDYDVIHAQDWLCARAVRSVKTHRVPLITTFHGLAPKRFTHDYVQEARGILASDAVVVPSQWLKNQYMSTYGMAEDRFTVIPHGIDSAGGRSAPDGCMNGHARSSAKTVFMCPARLSPEKGHQYLLQSLARLAHVRTDWECWLVGDGESRAALEQQCRDLQLDARVRFLGNRDDVGPLLRQADIFVLASTEDNCPFAVIEAQMAGKPVVVSAAGGIPELVSHGVTGLLSPIEDPDAMFRNLLGLLDGRALRGRLAANGRRWAVAHCSVDRMLRQTLATYARVSGSSARPIDVRGDADDV